MVTANNHRVNHWLCVAGVVFLLILTGCTVVFYGSVGSRKTFDVQAPRWSVGYNSDGTTSTVHVIDTVGEIAPPVIGAL